MPTDTRDFTNKYNTKLSPVQEKQFLIDMQDRLNDLYDYDLRGAWLELQNGNMSEDARGHLGDKYKKPNHITFSDESKYHNVDGYKGGHWSIDSHGSDVYTPSDTSLYSDDERKNYWLKGDEYGNGVHLNDASGNRILNGSTLTEYNPSIIDAFRNYLHNTSTEEKFMDAVGTGLSGISAIGPAYRGLAAARASIKNTPNALSNFFKQAGKGLVREIGENMVIDQIANPTAQGLANKAAIAEDAYRTLKLLR